MTVAIFYIKKNKKVFTFYSSHGIIYKSNKGKGQIYYNVYNSLN